MRAKIACRLPHELQAPLREIASTNAVIRASKATLPISHAFVVERQAHSKAIANGATDMTTKMRLLETAKAAIDAGAELLGRFGSNIVHSAARGVRTEKRTLRPFENLNTFQIERGA